MTLISSFCCKSKYNSRCNTFCDISDFIWGKVALALFSCHCRYFCSNDRNHENIILFDQFVFAAILQRNNPVLPVGDLFLFVARLTSVLFIHNRHTKYFTQQSQYTIRKHLMHIDVQSRYHHRYRRSQQSESFQPCLKSPPRTFFTTNHMRIGEATNPGPLQVDQFRIGLINPTTVLHREQAICDLDVDLLGMAETSATKPVQNMVQNNLRQQGYSSFWSFPVDNHRTMLNGQLSMRGAAAGVAIVSRIPVRTYREPLPNMVTQSSRVLIAYAQLGATTILTAVFYGFASSNDRAKEETNTFLGVISETLMSHPGPAILMGDFNHDPDNLPALEKLYQGDISPH